MRWRYPPPPPGEAPVITEEQPQVDAPLPETPAPSVAQTTEVSPPPARADLVQQEGEAEQLITVDSDVATITFSTQGAVARSWQLKLHRDAHGDPLELIHGDDTGLGFPLEFQLDDPALEAQLNDALFTSSVGDLPVVTMDAPGEVVFEWSSGNLAARKRIAFPNGYLTELETEVWVDGLPVPHRVRWGGGFGDLHAQAAGFAPNFLLRKSDKLLRVGIQAALETTGWVWKAAPQLPPFTGEAAYAGLEDRYFAALFIPETPALNVVVDSGEWIPVETHNGNGDPVQTDVSDGEEEGAEVEGEPQLLGAIAVGSSTDPQNRFQLYVGPKEITALQKVSLEPLALGQPIALEDEMVDFGWFWWVARPLLVAMQWIYANMIGNYGWAIILLTFVINLAMFPLKYKSSQQAWRMQKVAPRMKTLQAEMKKYKSTDPKRNELQQEMMGLYKKEGVNPLGGCLPLLIQFPFFLGFYRLLYSTIELRQAPWMGWVQDLSLPDPYYILPIVMTGTMFLSMQMTPQTTADPAQQRMMKMMPLIFGVMFLSFPSGLVLYWFTSNVVGVGQQWWINKEHQRFLEAEKQTAKERKKKKKHKGKQES
jgi:YidC/Oxa1 family membrane protein insertase